MYVLEKGNEEKKLSETANKSIKLYELLVITEDFIKKIEEN